MAVVLLYVLQLATEPLVPWRGPCIPLLALCVTCTTSLASWCVYFFIFEERVYFFVINVISREGCETISLSSGADRIRRRRSRPDGDAGRLAKSRRRAGHPSPPPTQPCPGHVRPDWLIACIVVLEACTHTMLSFLCNSSCTKYYNFSRLLSDRTIYPEAFLLLETPCSEIPS